MIRLFAALLFLLPLSAHASEAARALIDRGDYAEARDVGLAADTVDGLILAAEAMAAEIMLMNVDDPKDHAKAALDLVEVALEREPDNVEALFMRALHMGFRTRSSTPMGVIMHGLVGRTKEAIAAFAAAAPGDPRADALSGAWHLGIVRAGGASHFEASLTDGMAHYDRAVADMPGNIVVLGNYAFSLIVMDDPDLLPRAEILLRRIEATEPDGAVEAETRDRMLTLLAVIDDPQALFARSEGLLNTEAVPAEEAG